MGDGIERLQAVLLAGGFVAQLVELAEKFDLVEGCVAGQHGQVEQLLLDQLQIGQGLEHVVVGDGEVAVAHLVAGGAGHLLQCVAGEPGDATHEGGGVFDPGLEDGLGVGGVVDMLEDLGCAAPDGVGFLVGVGVGGATEEPLEEVLGGDGGLPFGDEAGELGAIGGGRSQCVIGVAVGGFADPQCFLEQVAIVGENAGGCVGQPVGAAVGTPGADTGIDERVDCEVHGVAHDADDHLCPEVHVVVDDVGIGHLVEGARLLVDLAGFLLAAFAVEGGGGGVHLAGVLLGHDRIVGGPGALRSADAVGQGDLGGGALFGW